MRKQLLIFLFSTACVWNSGDGELTWFNNSLWKRRLAGDNNVSDTFEGKRVKEQRGGKQISPSASYRHTHRNTQQRVTNINSAEQKERKQSPRGARALWWSFSIVPVLRAKSFCSVQLWHYTRGGNKQKSSLNSTLQSDDTGASESWWAIKEQRSQDKAAAKLLISSSLFWP